jgi:DNA-binding response OmpR family regulator
MLKVLIVEDDFMLADFAEEILVEQGYVVSGIAHGRRSDQARPPFDA